MHTHPFRVPLRLLFALVGSLFAGSPATAQLTVATVNKLGNGAGADFLISHPGVTADGRYVAFCSTATAESMVAGKASAPGAVSNVYVRDMFTSATELITVSAADANVSGNGQCAPAVLITPDGRYVAYRSTAHNLVSGVNTYPANSFSVFVRDRQAQTTVIGDVALDPSRAGGGVTSFAISDNGEFLAFNSYGTAENQLVFSFTNNNGIGTDLYIRYLPDSETRLVSRQYGTTNSGAAAVSVTGLTSPRVFSSDGSVLLFDASYQQILPGAAFMNQVYAYKWASDTITLVSANDGGSTFNSSGLTLNDVFSGYAISADGRYAVFHHYGQLASQAVSGFTPNVYLRDLQTSATTLISVTPGNQGGNGASEDPIISRDGSLIVFHSLATNLLAGITDSNNNYDIFAKPAAGGALELISRATSGTSTSTGTTGRYDVSNDGRYVSFSTTATDVVTGVTDTNNNHDVFVRDRTGGSTTAKSVVPAGTATGNVAAYAPRSLDGGKVGFFSDSGNLVAGITGKNVFVSAPSIADFSVTVNDAPDPALVGQQVTYTYTVTNNGPLAATASLAAPVPTGATFVSATGGATPSGGTVTFSLSSLNVGAQVQRTMTVTYGAAGQGTANATVSATGSGITDPVANNNSASATTTINPLPPTISGTVRDESNAAVAGVTLTLSGNASSTTTSAANGTYAFANLASGGNYTVTPSGGGYVYTPPSRTFTNVVANQSADFVASCSPVLTGLIRDRLDGAVPDVTVSLSVAVAGSNPGVSAFLTPAPVTTDVNGRYTFTGVTSGQTYTVTPSRTGFTFEPTSLQVAASGCSTNVSTIFLTSSGLFTRYFAEGATSTFFDTTIALLNATGTPTTARLTFQTGTGANVVHDVPLAGLARATVNPKTIPGLENAEFSTVIVSNQPVIADRTMHWDATGYGSHAETSIAQPLTTWYLAEGATIGNFNLFYLIQNPNDTAADVDVTYLLPAPSQPFTKRYTVPARTRQNIWVNVEDARLAHAEVSAIFNASVPVIVERSMYFDRGSQMFAAGHEAAAVPGPATQWFFAEGATGEYFDLFYLIANPGQQAAEIQGRYLLPDGSVLTKAYTVPGQSRYNIWADLETFPGVAGFPLGNTAVSATFTSTNGVPFIAERAMWWPGDATQWFEGHDSAGALLAGTKWGLADGETGAALGTETYVLIANTSEFDGSVKVTLVFEDGTTSEAIFPVKANSRTNVAVGTDIAAPAGKRFGTIVESLGDTPAQVVVERAMYNNANGVIWAAGSNNLGTRLR